MDRLNMQTANIADENFKKLAALFPNAVTETINENGEVVRAIDKDVLMQEINTQVVEGREERYQFTWPDKRKAIIAANAPTNNTLRPCREESVDFDKTENLYIEGDNLEVLKLLQENYLGKVKMIYIDPPYNTGNDFVYEDDFNVITSSEEMRNGLFDEDGKMIMSNYERNTAANGRFHTDWLNMIYPRLKVARDLLTDDGVIFISIDDNEVDNLKKSCDEIFGDRNFITYLQVELSLTQGMKVGAAQNGAIVKNGEFVLIYAKNKSNFKVANILYDGVNGYDTHFSVYLEENNGILSMIPIGDFLKRNNPDIDDFFDSNKLDHSFKSFCILIEKNSDFKKLIYSKYANQIFQSMMASVKIPLNIKEKLLKGEIVSYDKYLLHQVETGNIRQLLPLASTLGNTDDYETQYGRRRIRGNMWKGFYSDMMNVAKEGDVDFKNGKKPVRLLKQLIKWGAYKDSIILDFFSGSATTAHAVMQLNAEDGGNRKFIMVQLPELTDEKSEAYKAGYKNICEIGKERIRRAGKKIKEASPETTKNLDTGFRVLKLDSSNMQQIYYTPEETVAKNLFEATINNIKPDRTSEDLLFQAMLELNVPLSAKIEKQSVKGKELFSVESGYILACFDNNLTDEIITEIAKMKPYYFVMRDSSMADDSVAVNFEQLFKSYSPDTILKVF